MPAERRLRRVFCLYSLSERKAESIMCDLKAYLKKRDNEELLLESVNHVRTEGGEVTVRNLFGEERKVRGEVREVSLVKNRVVIEQN